MSFMRENCCALQNKQAQIKSIKKYNCFIVAGYWTFPDYSKNRA
jgi:hypothetical protein